MYDLTQLFADTCLRLFKCHLRLVRLMEADAVQTSPWAAQIINIDGNQIEVLVGLGWRPGKWWLVRW